MSAIIPFQFDDHAVRTVVDDNGEIWFVGKDVATVLGYSDTVNALKQHCRGVVKRHPILDTLGRQQEVRIISEPDLFRLVVNSKLPAAERFERWVFEDVLPAIRKTGSYSAPGALATLPAPTHDRVSAILLIGDAVAKVADLEGLDGQRLPVDDQLHCLWDESFQIAHGSSHHSCTMRPNWPSTAS